jgi:DNA primase large subunit
MVSRVSVRITLRNRESFLTSQSIPIAAHNFLRCQQLLTQDQPGPNDSHGCPFRHFALDNLQTALLSAYGSQGLTAADLPEIVATVKNHHYHVACTRVFEITHERKGVKKNDGLGGGESVTHPNQYTAKSRELEKPKEGAVKVEDDAMNVDS